MHAVARLALHPLIPNIQTLVGQDRAARAPQPASTPGANDLGGTLMNESITRAAGASFGQEMPPEAMEALIRGIGRTPRQRTTLYADAPRPPGRLLWRRAAVGADQHPGPALRTRSRERRRRRLSTPVEKWRNSRATGKNPGIFWGCCLPYGEIIIW